MSVRRSSSSPPSPSLSVSAAASTSVPGPVPPSTTSRRKRPRLSLYTPDLTPTCVFDSQPAAPPGTLLLKDDLTPSCSPILSGDARMMTFSLGLSMIPSPRASTHLDVEGAWHKERLADDEDGVEDGGCSPSSGFGGASRPLLLDLDTRFVQEGDCNCDAMDRGLKVGTADLDAEAEVNIEAIDPAAEAVGCEVTDRKRVVAWIGVAGQDGVPMLSSSDEGGRTDPDITVVLVREEYNGEGRLLSRIYSRY